LAALRRVPGYYNLPDLLANPTHPDPADLKEWIGGKFGPAYFNLDRTNAALKPGEAGWRKAGRATARSGCGLSPDRFA
jgi:hypothetical protein